MDHVSLLHYFVFLLERGKPSVIPLNRVFTDPSDHLDMALEGFQGSPRGDVSSMFPYMRCNVPVSQFQQFSLPATMFVDVVDVTQRLIGPVHLTNSAELLPNDPQH